MKSLHLLVLAVFSMTALAAPKTKSFAAKIITTLKPYEIWTDAHTFHNGLVWVGQIRTTDNGKDSLQVYDSEGKLLAESPLPHSASYVYNYDANQVLITGRSSFPWKTHYSLASYKNHSIRLKTVTFPSEIQVLEFAGGPGNLYFAELG